MVADMRWSEDTASVVETAEALSNLVIKVS